MRCPHCARDDDRVVDSRSADGGAAVRRRRACQACGQRFSTIERAEHAPLVVTKRNGTTEPFQREKLVSGVAKAVKNLDLDPQTVRNALADAEARIRGTGRREVGSDVVGAEVLTALRDLHTVAYMRFASVYKGFTSPEDFRRELASLQKQAPPKRPRISKQSPP